ncbi:hypothetical protein ACS0TY_001786 [Phlomoides rotata]
MDHDHQWLINFFNASLDSNQQIRTFLQRLPSNKPRSSPSCSRTSSWAKTDSKEIPQEIVVELDSGEPENVEKVEFGTRKDKTEIADIVEENGFNDNDKEWDAKNWDKADLKLQGKSAFSDVEVDSEPESLLKKEAKNACPAPQFVELPSAKSVLQNAVVTKRDSAAEGDDQKINKKNKKVDRLYGWKTQRNALIGTALKQQSRDVISDFKRRVTDIITQFMEQGVNTEVYNKNKDREEYHSIVPTSACTVLEVKVIEGHGATIDVILVSGVLHEGDQIVVCVLQGTYLHYEEIKAA